MNKLSTELDRLYGLGPEGFDPAGAAGAPLEARGRDVRAAVLAVLRPAGWEQLSSVWRGVQSDLELPAPAIAVSGTDAVQLWFSFASPVSAAHAARFLQGLRERYLPDVIASRVRAFAEATELPTAPCTEVGDERWSAFVTQDLAAIFEETPWLDVAPSDEGQATLLRALEAIRPAAFEAALKTLGGDAQALPEAPEVTEQPAVARPAAEPHRAAATRFLTGVMNDGAAPLALRIEAAGLLLAHGKRA